MLPNVHLFLFLRGSRETFLGKDLLFLIILTTTKTSLTMQNQSHADRSGLQDFEVRESDELEDT